MSEEPYRYWILNPITHIDLVLGEQPRLYCGECGTELNVGTLNDPNPIPVNHSKLLCENCVTVAIQDHPVTVEYLEKMTSGDHEWWSQWFCGCPGCKAELERMKKGENGWKLHFMKPSLPTPKSG